MKDIMREASIMFYCVFFGWILLISIALGLVFFTIKVGFFFGNEFIPKIMEE